MINENDKIWQPQSITFKYVSTYERLKADYEIWYGKWIKTNKKSKIMKVKNLARKRTKKALKRRK